MKYLDEYRDPETVKQLVHAIRATATREWNIMEICGGQTHSIMRHGLDEMLAGKVNLIHGPGCPVCVTPLETIDRALRLAALPGMILCSYGDMLRVPGTEGSLLHARATGADVRMVYSPMDALAIARENPDRQVVFFAVGFETTAPVNGMSAYQARRQGSGNFSLLASHVLVPPALRAILGAPGRMVQGVLAAGHVCTVMGTGEYEPLAADFRAPIVVTGFEPVDILQGIRLCVEALEKGRAEVVNAYPRSVRREGNPQAKALLADVFEVADRNWRGIGVIPQSGYALRPEYAAQDAEKKFDLGVITTIEPGECISGLVLQGLKKPDQCPAFGKTCTPEYPLGATMVSSEGACAAYYRYKK